jgi:hypothetical protein
MQLNVVKLRSVAAFNAYKLIVRTSLQVPELVSNRGSRSGVSFTEQMPLSFKPLRR